MQKKSKHPLTPLTINDLRHELLLQDKRLGFKVEILEAKMDLKMEAIERKIDDKAEKRHHKLLAFIDRVVKELEEVREENIFQNADIETLKKGIKVKTQ